MSRPALVAQAAAEVDDLLADAGPLTRLTAVARMNARAEQVRRMLEDEQRWLRRPLQVALIGETGVGKSALFNALIGRAEASSTADLRCHTDYPVVAVSPADRPRLNLDPDAHAHYVKVPELSNLALIDTPDFNGAKPEHHERARQVIRHADLIIYITIPDQRADMSGLEELARWRATHRFLFVINKMDREQLDGDPIRRDFARRLHDLGFHAPPSRIFLTSTTDTAGTDLPRLRDLLLRHSDDPGITIAREDAALGHLQHVLAPGLRENLEATRQHLEGALDRHQQEVQRIYTEALSDPHIERLLKRMVREQSWLEAARVCWWPMSTMLHVRNRFALLMTGYHVARSMVGGGLVRLLRAAMASMAAASAGIVPVMRLADVIDERLGDRLRSLQPGVRRSLQENGLEPPGELHQQEKAAASAEMSVDSGMDEGRGKPRGLGGRLAGEAVDEVQRRFAQGFTRLLGGRETSSELIRPLQRAVTRAGEEAAGRGLGPVTQCLVNILPLAAIGHVGWRLADGWITADYLEWPFYPMALAVILLSFIPGWIWLGVRLRMAGGTPDTVGVLAQMRDHPVLRPLSGVIDRLGDFEHRARSLAHRIEQMRRELSSQIPAQLGETVVHEPGHPAPESVETPVMTRGDGDEP